MKSTSFFSIILAEALEKDKNSRTDIVIEAIPTATAQ